MKMEKMHRFSQEEAQARVQALTDYWDTRYNTQTIWTGNRATINGKVKGISFEGSFSIESDRLVADVKVGWLAEKIGGKAYVERKLMDYLSPGVTLEELQAKV
jgi:hypothetical protein